MSVPSSNSLRGSPPSPSSGTTRTAAGRRPSRPSSGTSGRELPSASGCGTTTSPRSTPPAPSPPPRPVKHHCWNRRPGVGMVTIVEQTPLGHHSRHGRHGRRPQRQLSCLVGVLVSLSMMSGCHTGCWRVRCLCSPPLGPARSPRLPTPFAAVLITGRCRGRPSWSWASNVVVANVSAHAANMGLAQTWIPRCRCPTSSQGDGWTAVSTRLARVESDEVYPAIYPMSRCHWSGRPFIQRPRAWSETRITQWGEAT